jgi:hypothetical protein
MQDLVYVGTESTLRVLFENGAADLTDFNSEHNATHTARILPNKSSVLLE